MSTATTNSFDFKGMNVRVVMIDGDPWFLARDVREALGVAQHGRNFAFLGTDEVRQLPSGLISGKGMDRALILSESGLYKFILRSDKPNARPFQDWVTREVLPAIRKDGAYVAGEENAKTPEDFMALASAAIEKKLAARIARHQKLIDLHTAKQAEVRQAIKVLRAA